MSKSAPVDIDALIATAKRRQPGGTCLARIALEAMPADLVAKLTPVLTDKANYSHPGVARLFQQLADKYGHPEWALSRSTLERHRNGECRCGK